jgi:hypothetical protein
MPNAHIAMDALHNNFTCRSVERKPGSKNQHE